MELWKSSSKFDETFPKFQGLASVGAPLSEAATLAMPYDEAIHEKYHIPMATYRLIISHLVLIKPQVIFPTEIEFVYGIPKAPATQYRWRITECIIAHKHIYVIHIFCGVGLTITTRRLPDRFLTFSVMSATYTLRIIFCLFFADH
jgi:hypothetical protein